MHERFGHSTIKFGDIAEKRIREIVEGISHAHGAKEHWTANATTNRP